MSPATRFRPTRLRLDGQSGFIDVPPTKDEDLDMAGNSLTLAIWIKPSQSYHDEELLVEHGVWQRSNGMYQLTTLDSGTLRFNFPAMNSNEGPLEATVNLVDGNWHFAVATFDTSTHLAKIYDNGVLLKSKTVHASIARDDTPTKTFVGCRGNGTYHFGGEVGQLLIYKRAISAEQVARLYGQAGGDIDSRDTVGLVAGYHLDEGRGTTAADFSGHGNSGTLKGGVTWTQGKLVSLGVSAAHTHAMPFDGTRYASLPQSTKFTSGDFTISLWFNPVKAAAFQFLFMRGFSYRDQQGDIGLKINRYSGELNFQARTADSQWLFGWDAPESRLRSPFQLKEWNHVVVTRRGDTYAMWMNGAKVGSERSWPIFPTLTTPIRSSWAGSRKTAASSTRFRAFWTSSASSTAACPTRRSPPCTAVATGSGFR